MKYLFIFLLFVSVNLFSQNPTNYQYRYVRERSLAAMFDSALHVPRYNGTPSGIRVGSSTHDGAVAVDTANHRFYIYSNGGWIRMASYSELTGAYKASNGLTLSGSDFQLGGSLTGDVTIANGDNTLLLTGNTAAADPILSITSNSTAATSNTQTGLYVSMSGVNANSSQATYGQRISNTHSGTSSENVGLGVTSTSSVTGTGVSSQVTATTTANGGSFTASNATTNNGLYVSASGGTNNYAIVVPSGGGTVGIGTITPTGATKLDVVDNSVAGASIVNISSTSTAAASDLQKGLNISLSGANSNSGQDTYGIYSANTHTGTGSYNYGGYFTATGGGVNYGVYSVGTTAGVYGISNTTHGVQGNGAQYGVYGSGDIGLVGISSTNTAIFVQRDDASTNSVLETARFYRSTSGTAANGIGLSVNFENRTTTTNQVSNQIISKWADATNATRTSQFIITGVNSGTLGDIISFEGNKRTMLYGRLEMQQGADVASVAGAIAVGTDGNVFELTGTNAVTLISNLNWVNGSMITLIFTSTATLTDGTANSGTDIGMELAGNANFSGSADDVITLVLSEVGGTQRWREVSRSVN